MKSKKLNLLKKGLAGIIIILFLFTLLNYFRENSPQNNFPIEGSTDVNPTLLYALDTALNSVKKEVEHAASGSFTINGSLNTSIKEGILYDEGSTENGLLASPYQWITDRWFEDEELSKPVTKKSSHWPIYKEVNIAGKEVVLRLPEPQWTYKEAGKFFFLNVMAQEVEEKKSITLDVNIDFRKNLLVFQTFRKEGNRKESVDNFLNNNVVINLNKGYGASLGGEKNNTQISGIYTGNNKLLQVCVNRGKSWEPFALLRLNKENKTFIVGPYDKKTSSVKNGCICSEEYDGTCFSNEIKNKINDFNNLLNEGWKYKVVQQRKGQSCQKNIYLNSCQPFHE
ncbi:MAG: hypothetical protein HQK84_11600 [Nitrospinae bacterium]|nr:hypothetical protein [Nitrospinota bacterium]